MWSRFIQTRGSNQPVKGDTVNSMQFSNPNQDWYGQGLPGNFSAGQPYIRRRHRLRGCLVLLVVLVLIGVGTSLVLRNTMLLGPTVISTSPHPTLVLDSQAYHS